jgi:peptidoglycan/LPS O-acetylase OafA/YrhL
LDKKPEFVGRLQSVRGLAALTVAAYHSIIIFNAGTRVDHVRLIALNVVDGEGAVFFFFILSGFVLGFTLSKREPRHFSVSIDFLRRRFFRLFPVMLVSTLIYCVFHHFYTPLASGGIFAPWSTIKPIVSFGTIVRNICLLSTSINPVTWSLQVEWLFSIVVPFIYFVIGRSFIFNGIVFAILFGIFYFFGYTALHVSFNSAPLTYLFMCYAGWIVALARHDLQIVLNRAPRFLINVLIGLALLVCTTFQHFGASLPVYTLAATFLVAVVALDPKPALFKVLDWKPLIILGDLSYSFYLFNPLFLLLVAKTLSVCVSAALLTRHIWLSSLTIFVGSVLLTAPFSYLSFNFCELPFTSAQMKQRRIMPTLKNA